MATMNINIINPVINLYSGIEEESNSCRSVFYFTIKTTPFAVISISVDNSGREDYISLSAKGFVGHRGGRYTSIPSNTKAGSNGEIQVRLIIDNNVTQSPTGGMNGCNDATIEISDYSNNILVERKKFSRCGGLSCDDFPLPVPYNDSYKVPPGSEAILDIMSNDDPKTSYGYITPSIESQPSYGTVEVLDNGSVKYTNNGTGTSDSFTYHITNNIGQTSENTATVSIDINEESRIINTSTKVILLFDDSGSMDTTHNALLYMKDNELKDVLLRYYNEDIDLYNQQVTMQNIGDITEIEHSFDAVTQLAGDDTIFIVFQDEAESDYHAGINSFSDSTLEPIYQSHIESLNTKLATVSRCTISFLQIQGYPAFRSFLKAVENGTGAYSGNHGLSGNDNFNIKYDVLPDKSSTYYKDEVVGILKQLGFDL